MTNVRKRKRAGEELLATEEKSRLLFKGLPVPAYVWKRAGDDFILADYNDAADAITRAGVARILGTTARALYADAPDILEDFERCFREKRPVRRQMTYRLRTTGETREFDVTYRLIPPDSVFVHTQDVTERKRTEEELKGSRERLLMVSRRLIEAHEEERRNIARELHDEIGQELTALKINLQTASQAGNAEVVSRLADSLEIVERTTKQVRDLSLALRPLLLDDLGLVAALRWHADGEAKRAGFTLDFVAEPADIRPAPEIGIACYRVVQEALTNVARHARARHVRVELAAGGGWLDLRIHDDGVGFDARAARERAASGASFGLLSMTERTRLLDGRLEIDSAPGRGTEIHARFPVNVKER